MRQRVDQLERALHRRDRLQRMEVGEAGQPRHLLVEPRIVLHRARAERVEAAVDRVVLLRQPGEVAHDLRLAEAGQADRALPLERRRARSRCGGGSGRSTPQWPGESCSKISGSSICSPRLPLIVCAVLRLGRDAVAQRLAPVAHRSTSSSAAAKAVDVVVGRWSRSPRPAADRRRPSRSGIEAADRDAGEDAASGQRLDDRRRGPRQAQRQSR